MGKETSMPCNEANKDAIIMEIKKEFQEMSDAAKYAAQDYKRTKAFDSAIRIDLQAARVARFGENPKQPPPPLSPANNRGGRRGKGGEQVRDSTTAIPMPDLSTPSSSSPQPGLCGPSDKEYSTSSDVEDVEVVVLSGSRPSSAPGSRHDTSAPGVRKP